VSRYLVIVALACACDGSDPGGDANPDDLDSDGLLNVDDNCPRAANVDQHDEDGDTVGDACDNCPSVANPSQADTTELAMRALPDGVGDVCDPRTGVSGDELRAFHSFATDAQASAWTGNGWTISGDAAHAGGIATWTSARAVQGDGFLVRVEVASIVLVSQSALAITLDGDGVATGATCALRDQQLTVTEAAGAMNSVALSSAIVADEPLTLIAWRTISLVQGARVPEITCRVTRGKVTNETSLPLIDDVVTGSYVLGAIDSSVDITSLSVYTSPGPKNP
jgi:hypothetical protein